jgi:predicted transcriptional regulator
MNNNTGNKYKMFRNYMANELGITKEEIKEWAKEAVEESVKKLMGQMNISGLIDQKIKYELPAIKEIAKQVVRDQLAVIVESRLKVDITLFPES